MFTDVHSHPADHGESAGQGWRRAILESPANWLRLAAVAVNLALWALIFVVGRALLRR